MKPLKYLLTKQGDLIVFSDGLSHSEMAGRRDIVGAGFIRFHDTNDAELARAECYGESVSLKIKSRKEEDEEIINRRIKYY